MDLMLERDAVTCLGQNSHAGIQSDSFVSKVYSFSSIMNNMPWAPHWLGDLVRATFIQQALSFPL